MKGNKFMKLSKLRILAYFFFILQIFLYIVNAENYSKILLQLNSNNPELSPASNTGMYIGTFIALTFFFWIGFGIIYLEKRIEYKKRGK